MSQKPTMTRYWMAAGLAIYLVIAGLVLTLPVSYRDVVAAIGGWLRSNLGISWFGTGWIEFGANILIFLPLGLLLTLLVGHHWWGVLLALGVSALAELAQLVIPSRQPSLRDIIANVLGAGIGAAIAWLIMRRSATAQRRPAVSR